MVNKTNAYFDNRRFLKALTQLSIENTINTAIKIFCGGYGGKKEANGNNIILKKEILPPEF